MELAIDHRTPSLAPPSRPRSEALSAVLAELGERVKPVVLARERTVPVAAPFDEIFPAGLVRGQVVSCAGAAAVSMSFGLVRDALVAGAWLAVVDVASFGADAAAEFGIPLERVVRIHTGTISGSSSDAASNAGAANGSAWIDVMGAAVDGFDVVLTRVPSALATDRRPAAVRKLNSRMQQKGAVVITLGASGALTVDVELSTRHTLWDGLGDGCGHLRQRRIDVEASGRRMPGIRSCSIALAGVANRIEFGPAPVIPSVADRDPQAELLDEMVEASSPRDAVVVTDLSERRIAG